MVRCPRATDLAFAGPLVTLSFFLSFLLLTRTSMVPFPPPTPLSQLRRDRFRGGRLAIVATGTLTALVAALSAPSVKAAAPLVQPSQPSQPSQPAQILYTLETKCSLRGAAPVVCTVEVLDEGGVTLYRHRIGSNVQSVRVSADPSRMEMWDGASRSWRNLRNAEARFSTNTVCFNDRELCVVNTNYLNSLLEDRPDLRGRDYVRAHFGPNGRVDLICYDGGCDLLAQSGAGVKP